MDKAEFSERVMAIEGRLYRIGLAESRRHLLSFKVRLSFLCRGGRTDIVDAGGRGREAAVPNMRATK